MYSNDDDRRRDEQRRWEEQRRAEQRRRDDAAAHDGGVPAADEVGRARRLGVGDRGGGGGGHGADASRTRWLRYPVHAVDRYPSNINQGRCHIL